VRGENVYLSPRYGAPVFPLPPSISQNLSKNPNILAFGIFGYFVHSDRDVIVCTLCEHNHLSLHELHSLSCIAATHPECAAYFSYTHDSEWLFQSTSSSGLNHMAISLFADSTASEPWPAPARKSPPSVASLGTKARAESPARQRGTGLGSQMLRPTSMQKSPRMEPGADSDGLVAPRRTRPAFTTPSPSQTIGTTGPDDMYSTRDCSREDAGGQLVVVESRGCPHQAGARPAQANRRCRGRACAQGAVGCATVPQTRGNEQCTKQGAHREEGLGRKVAIVSLEELRRGLHELEGHKLEALLLEALDDLRDDPALDAVRLDHDEGALAVCHFCQKCNCQRPA
jgi:hypothetical protein